MKVWVVEDEDAAYQRMVRLLEELGATVVGRASSVREAVDWVKADGSADLALFDVRLADGDSFAVFREVDLPCPVVFTTAFDAHALEAFRVHAVDYLLKPIKREELSAALQRVRNLGAVRDLAPLASTGSAEGRSFAKRFLIRYGDVFKVVVPDDIAYLHSRDKYTFLRTREGRDLPLDESLDRLEKQLDPEKFFRLNRQLILHFDSIRELVAYSKSRVKVVLEPPFTDDAVVSSERSPEFKRWLAGG